MAIKIEIIGNALVVTDTVTDEIIIETPKKLVYYNVDRLVKESIIEIVDIDSTTSIQLSFKALPIGAETLNGADAAFTIASFQTFARTNLGG